ncbi:hypothetical protein BJ742DRAFT_348288 [Cladochytrium replicatum]|nr:hypothetical protein BJ742DRAFT_348288 [Cladochytrium replicatum]
MKEGIMQNAFLARVISKPDGLSALTTYLSEMRQTVTKEEFTSRLCLCAAGGGIMNSSELKQYKDALITSIVANKQWDGASAAAAAVDICARRVSDPSTPLYIRFDRTEGDVRAIRRPDVSLDGDLTQAMAGVLEGKISTCAGEVSFNYRLRIQEFIKGFFLTFPARFNGNHTASFNTA